MTAPRHPKSVAPRKPCSDGFHWIGQSFASCDRCGHPAWDHPGMSELDSAASSFGPDTDWRMRPWRHGEAEAIRKKWDPSLPVWRCPGDNSDLSGRGKMWERRTDENPAAPPICPDHGNHRLVAGTRGIG